MATAGEVRDLLEERPDLEPALEAVLEPEAPFDFDDVAVDSGPFGELVSRGIVESVDGGYRVSNPDAVRGALSDEAVSSTARARPSLSLSLPNVQLLALLCLFGAVLVVVTLRLSSLPTVFYRDHVFLAGNDPYFYRYWVDQLLAEPSVTPTSLGSGIAKGEPLLVTSLWLISVVAGGTKAVGGYVLAWYPVVSAAVTGVVVYLMAVLVTDDRRIGLASVLMLAIIPGHAFRTSLGFADHHAFDYVWMVLTLVALTIIAREGTRWTVVPSGRAVGGSLVLGVAVTTQTLAWDNSPIILVAIGGYLALEGLRSVSTSTRPYRTIGPVILGTGVGAGVTWLVHTRFGWHTTLVASAPTLLVIGGVGVLVGAELVDRVPFPTIGADPGYDATPAALLGLEVLGLVGGVTILKATRPAFWNRLATSVEGRLLARREIAEVQGLFSDAGGWLLLLGFGLFLGLSYLVWASNRARTDGRWLPAVAYGWYFLVLASIQVRFVGQLALPLALFGGVGLVHLAEGIDVARAARPLSGGHSLGLTLPTGRQFVALGLLFLLVGSLGIIQVPVKTSQTTTPNAQADAALWMANYTETNDLQWPSNYVFSQWGRNRMYNYYVSGESQSYRYAQSNFESFVFSTDTEGWYERLGNRRGFVVTTNAVVGEPDHIGTRLHRANGAGSEATEALSHYRLVHVTGDGAYKVFTIVPGAVIQGTTEMNMSVTASTTVDVGSIEFSYERTTESNADGRYAIRVAQPGTYSVGNTTVSINETNVQTGASIPTSD